MLHCPVRITSRSCLILMPCWLLPALWNVCMQQSVHQALQAEATKAFAGRVLQELRELLADQCCAQHA